MSMKYARCVKFAKSVLACCTTLAAQVTSQLYTHHTLHAVFQSCGLVRLHSQCVFATATLAAVGCCTLALGENVETATKSATSLM